MTCIQTHDGGYLIVGVAVPDAYAANCGANVGDDEAAILLAAAVMAAHEKPLRDEIARLNRETAWREPEAINTATGAPHHVTIADDGTFEIRHNLGCRRNGGRREARTGELICQVATYLDQTDEDERPGPGDYWVTVDVYGRSEEYVEAGWTPVDAQPLRDRIAELEARIKELEAERDPAPVTDIVQLVIPRGPILDGLTKVLDKLNVDMAGPLPLEREPIPTYVLQPRLDAAGGVA